MAEKLRSTDFGPAIAALEAALARARREGTRRPVEAPHRTPPEHLPPPLPRPHSEGDHEPGAREPAEHPHRRPDKNLLLWAQRGKNEREVNLRLRLIGEIVHKRRYRIEDEARLLGELESFSASVNRWRSWWARGAVTLTKFAIPVAAVALLALVPTAGLVTLAKWGIGAAASALANAVLHDWAAHKRREEISDEGIFASTAIAFLIVAIGGLSVEASTWSLWDAVRWLTR